MNSTKQSKTQKQCSDDFDDLKKVGKEKKETDTGEKNNHFKLGLWLPVWPLERKEEERAATEERRVCRAS